MKNWKAVLFTLVLILVCIVPCVALCMTGGEEEPAEVCYTVRDAALESEEATDGSPASDMSVVQLGILAVAAVVITIVFGMVPGEEPRWKISKTQEGNVCT